MLVKPIPGTNLRRWYINYSAVYVCCQWSKPTGPQQTFRITMETVGNLEFTTKNLLGVGWLERSGKPTFTTRRSQDLITNIPWRMTICSLKTMDDVDRRRLCVPSARKRHTDKPIKSRLDGRRRLDDGIGAPGSSVFIVTPTNGSLASGAINSIKIVTVGQPQIPCRNVYPFSWFNAVISAIPICKMPTWSRYSSRRFIA